MIHCKRCGEIQPELSSRADRIARAAELLIDAAVRLGMTITVDGRINEPDAARLLGIQHGALKNLRLNGVGPSWIRRGIGGFKLSYSIADLATWIEGGRVETSTHSRR